MCYGTSGASMEKQHKPECALEVVPEDPKSDLACCAIFFQPLLALVRQ